MAKNLFDYGKENLGYEEDNLTNYINSDKVNNAGNANYNGCNSSQCNSFSNNNFNNASNYNNTDYGSNQNNNSNFYNQANNQTANNNSKESLQAEAENLYEKYKNYSQQDLISEFLSSSKQKLKQGTLTQNQINSTVNALIPFLNDSQKQALSQLLEQLND